ncbi:MAG TPA: hypothetical protein VG498_02165 [Terriglobales bacterium]|nr:hypothetical protein [Terriglobales bacterium]
MKHLLLFALITATSVWAENPRSFSGEIADSSCALNVHSLTRSHREMLQGTAMGKTAKDCSHICVEHYGAHYVLQDKNNVFNLDDQTKAAQFAGSKVKINGTLLPNNTIHIVLIEIRR